MSEEVITRREGSALVVTINRESRRNALNEAVAEGLIAALDLAEADPQVRAVILTGAGDKAFCAGADLQPGRGMGFGQDRPNSDYADLLRLSQNATKPSIARVNGACMAGGMGLLCMTDMAVAADHVVFGLPEVKVGVFPMQVLSLLQDMVPRRLVAEWCLTGEPFTPAEAVSAGLINYAVPAQDLDAKVAWLAARLIDKSPMAIHRGKYAMRAIRAMSFDEAIAYTEAQIALTAQTADAKEGIAAFAEKRKPNWG